MLAGVGSINQISQKRIMSSDLDRGSDRLHLDISLSSLSTANDAICDSISPMEDDLSSTTMYLADEGMFDAVGLPQEKKKNMAMQTTTISRTIPTASSKISKVPTSFGVRTRRATLAIASQFNNDNNSDPLETTSSADSAIVEQNSVDINEEDLPSNSRKRRASHLPTAIAGARVVSKRRCSMASTYVSKSSSTVEAALDRDNSCETATEPHVAMDVVSSNPPMSFLHDIESAREDSSSKIDLGFPKISNSPKMDLALRRTASPPHDEDKNCDNPQVQAATELDEIVLNMDWLGSGTSSEPSCKSDLTTSESLGGVNCEHKDPLREQIAKRRASASTNRRRSMERVSAMLDSLSKDVSSIAATRRSSYQTISEQTPNVSKDHQVDESNTENIAPVNSKMERRLTRSMKIETAPEKAVVSSAPAPSANRRRVSLQVISSASSGRGRLNVIRENVLNQRDEDSFPNPMIDI